MVSVPSLKHLYYNLAASIVKIISIKLKNLLTLLISHYLYVLGNLLFIFILSICILIYNLYLDPFQLDTILTLSNRLLLLLIISLIFLVLLPIRTKPSYNPLHATTKFYDNENCDYAGEYGSEYCGHPLIIQLFLIWNNPPIFCLKSKLFTLLSYTRISPICSILNLNCSYLSCYVFS